MIRARCVFDFVYCKKNLLQPSSWRKLTDRGRCNSHVGQKQVTLALQRSCKLQLVGFANDQFITGSARQSFSSGRINWTNLCGKQERSKNAMPKRKVSLRDNSVLYFSSFFVNTANVQYLLRGLLSCLSMFLLVWAIG